MKLVFSSRMPWANLSIETLQREFNAAFPKFYAELQVDDAATVWVLNPLRSARGCDSHHIMQTIRDLGILRCQIGNEAIKAVIKHLPGQYNKRMLESQSARVSCTWHFSPFFDTLFSTSIPFLLQDPSFSQVTQQQKNKRHTSNDIAKPIQDVIITIQGHYWTNHCYYRPNPKHHSRRRPSNRSHPPRPTN